MMTTIDVYKDWLEIEATNRPLNYYQILKLNQFEDNNNVIRKQYRQLNALVRKYASGEFGEESQNLLNELAKAMLCLTDAARKVEYDASIGRKQTTVKRRATLDDILLRNKIVPEDRMKQVKGYADAVGIDLQQAVLQQKIAAPEIVMLAYAESIGLPFISLDDVGVDTELAPQIDPNTARLHSFVPVTIDQGKLILASPTPVNPDVEEELRMIFEMPVRCAICTPAQINEAIAKYYPKDAVQLIAKNGKTKTPSSAKPVPEKKTKTDAKESEEEYEPVEPLGDEQSKTRMQYTILAFCFSIMIVGIGSSVSGFATDRVLIVTVGGVLLGAIASGVTWMIMSR